MARFATTSAPLAANGTWDTGWLVSDVFDTVTGSIFSDQACTVFVEQSADQVNADVSTSYAIAAADGKGIDEKLLLPYYRVRVLNGPTLQGTFRVWVRAASAGNKY